MQIITRREFLKAASALGAVATAGRSLDAFAQQEVLKVGVVHQYPIGDVGWETQHALGW
jgi:simple sugar transport system substrate-binding protein